MGKTPGNPCHTSWFSGDKNVEKITEINKEISKNFLSTFLHSKFTPFYRLMWRSYPCWREFRLLVISRIVPATVWSVFMLDSIFLTEFMIVVWSRSA